MAKNSVKEWSKTAASNTDVGGIGITGSSSLASGNDAMQEIMEQVATQFGIINAKGADIASATTTDLATATGNAVDITGTTTITGLGTVDAGQVFILQFDGALTLTHNATSLKLPGGASIVTAAGDIAVMISEGSGNWRCVNYERAVKTYRLIKRTMFTSNGTWTPVAGLKLVRFICQGAGGGGGNGASNGSGVSTGNGGGGGAYEETWLTAGWGATETVTVGTGGAGAAAAATAGTGTSGGTGGEGATRVTADQRGGGVPGLGGSGTGAGGTTFTARLQVKGGYGSYGFVFGVGSTAISGAGGSSMLGVGGLSRQEGTAGIDGQGYGGGGSGGSANSATSRAGGNGAPGVIIIEEYD
jgi:hypothetical protein